MNVTCDEITSFQIPHLSSLSFRTAWTTFLKVSNTPFQRAKHSAVSHPPSLPYLVHESFHTHLTVQLLLHLETALEMDVSV
jgi:hypothetical protein